LSDTPETPKIYVVDTSVPMHEDEALENFGDNCVFLHIAVVEELEGLKKADGEKGASARAALRKIVAFSDQGSLTNGVPTRGGGRIFISYTSDEDFQLLPVGLEKTNDNRMILLAKKLQNANPCRQVIVVSKENSMRIKANACGLLAQDYKHDKLVSSLNELYSGFSTIVLEKDELGAVAELLKVGSLDESFIKDALASDLNLHPNQCCLIRNSDGQEAMAIYKKQAHTFVLVKPRSKKTADELIPRNMYQWFAYALLTDPSVRVLTLCGVAGAGKTLMSLCAGIEQLGGLYNQLTVFRTPAGVGLELGFMPGDLHEKFKDWKKPILKLFNRMLGHPAKDDKKKSSKKSRSSDLEITEASLGDSLEIGPIMYLQGDTFFNQFVIADETQNITPKEAEIVRTRLGEGSKIVFTGDPTQIVRPHLDSISNGLVSTIALLAGAEYYGHLNMPISERDDVVQDMIERAKQRTQT